MLAEAAANEQNNQVEENDTDEGSGSSVRYGASGSRAKRLAREQKQAEDSKPSNVVPLNPKQKR